MKQRYDLSHNGSHQPGSVRYRAGSDVMWLFGESRMNMTRPRYTFFAVWRDPHESTDLPIYLSTYPPIYLSTDLPVYLSTYLPKP